MPEEYPVHHEQAPDSQGDQAPEDINQMEDPEAGLSMTMRGENDWQNNLNPDRMAAESEMVSHLAEVIPVGDQPAETSEVAPLPTQPGVDNIAPVADIPEKTALTPEEIENHKIYAAALDYDMTNPKDFEYTPEQERSIEIMDGLLKKYPHAFIERLTDDGRKYALLKTTGVDSFIDFADIQKNLGGRTQYGKQTLIFSYRGVTQIGRDAEDCNLTPILDMESTKSPLTDETAIHLNKYDGSERQVASPSEDIINVRHIRYGNIDLDSLKLVIAQSEKTHEDDYIPGEITAKNILDLL